MGTTAEKGAYIIETKSLLKQKINNLGGEITSETTFREYANQLQNVYDNLPKTDYAEGSNITLSNTLKGKLDFEDGIIGYGDTQQNGTPTPDSPQEIEVVRGKNRLDDSNLILFNSNKYICTNSYTTQGKIGLKPNTTYTLAYLKNTLNDMGMWEFDSSNNKTAITYTASSNGNYNIRLFTTLSTTKTMSFYAGSNDTYTSVEEFLNAKELMILEGDYSSQAIPPYLPYNTIEEVVSGKNEINNTATSSTQSGITFTINEDKSVKVNGTYSATVYFPLTSTSKIEPNTEYILSGASSPSCRLRVREYDINNNNLSEYFDQSYGVTFTSKSNADHINVQIVVYGSQTNAMCYPMLRKSSITDDTYEPYITPTSYQLSLGDHKFYGIGTYKDYILRTTGKNLFDKSKVINSYYVNAGTGELSGSTTAYNASDWIEVSPGDYVWGATSTTGYSLVVYDENKQYVRSVGRSIVQQIKVTIAEGEKYVRYTVSTADLDTQQFERGSLATDYEPYGVGDWYKVGKINDYKITGNEAISVNTDLTNTSRIAMYTALSDKPSVDVSVKLPLSNYFVGVQNWSGDVVGIYTNSGSIVFRVPKTIATTEQEIKTWLSSHNVIVCYVLATPTIDIITGTLAEQLEAWWNGQSIDGTTIIEGDGDLPMIIKVRALKGE